MVRQTLTLQLAITATSRILEARRRCRRKQTGVVCPADCGLALPGNLPEPKRLKCSLFHRQRGATRYSQRETRTRRQRSQERCPGATPASVRGKNCYRQKSALLSQLAGDRVAKYSGPPALPRVPWWN